VINPLFRHDPTPAASTVVPEPAAERSGISEQGSSQYVPMTRREGRHRRYRQAPCTRSNGGTLVMYTGRAALRMEQCYMTPESQHNGVTRDSIARQRLRKYVPAATDTQETTEKLLELVFSIRSASKIYTR
jgi:hypothetical protein